MANTIGGAIREVLQISIPGLEVFRKTALPDAQLPIAVINENITTQSRDLGDELAINEEVQLDLYTEYADATTIIDDIHKALHKAPLNIPSSLIHRCRVVQRATDVAAEGNDDGVERTTYTLQIIRML